MSFAAPHYLWLLLALPPAMIAFFWWSGRARQRLRTRFIQARLLPGLIAGMSPARQKLRAACLILAAAFLVLALARPQWGYDLEEVRQRGLDIVVAVDTSKSMLADDIAPDRLERAKLAVLDLMHQAKFDRLGLVAFAGTAFLQCPLTVDDAAFRQCVEALDVNTLPEGGTALAAAIETASQAFTEGGNYKVLVLFTDGEDHDSGALEAARKAAKHGLRIFTVGIGSADGAILRIKGANGQTDYIRDEHGNVVKSRLNQRLLEQIASAAKGFYLPLRGANTMDVLYERGLAPLPKSESKERWMKRARERYQWPLALGIMLLVVEILLPERKREPWKRATGAGVAPAPTGAALLLALLAAGTAQASPASALREYKSGNYPQALRDYEQALKKNAEDPRLHFNAGAAAYRDQNFGQAARYFTNALAAPDLNLQEQAYYNLGNTLYHLGERNPDPQKKIDTWEGAVSQYDSAIQLNTNDADARFNYEFVKKKLEQLKRQQQQQKQNQKQQNQNQQSQQPQSSQDKRQQPSQSQQQQPQPQSSPSQSQQQQQQAQQQQARQSPEPEKPKPSETQPERKSPAQEQKQPKPGQEQQKAYAAGQMTPQEARQLLDAQKNDEMMLPVSRKEKSSNPERQVKDW